MAERKIYEIAEEISATWANVNFAAVPYLDALRYIATKEDYYGADPATSVAAYFLANASGFRGADARRLKAELKVAAGISKPPRNVPLPRGLR